MLTQYSGNIDWKAGGFIDNPINQDLHRNKKILKIMPRKQQTVFVKDYDLPLTLVIYRVKVTWYIDIVWQWLL